MAETKIVSNVPYQEAVGCVLYLAQCTRPDISFSVASVSQFNQQHGQAHWTAVKRILRYLKGTLHYKLTYALDTKFDELCGYTDADWASSFVDIKSCTGYAFLWQGAAISWATKKQPTVALSTAESEYMSLSAATQEALWLSQLKKEILGGDWSPLEIFCDNKAAVDLTETGTFSLRTNTFL
ncbi:secreted RxLR effector protein 161-like [Rhagoletis pomonella]|uniref:secreted RxLR effector protein 161-like n=1 Tax=Rhagoletis pomonella TaxID=28610 RepID=UPI0017863B66|nr:secreted RxLR effector protein 161-like [Rhagoletis pomonella]